MSMSEVVSTVPLRDWSRPRHDDQAFLVILAAMLAMSLATAKDIADPRAASLSPAIAESSAGTVSATSTCDSVKEQSW